MADETTTTGAASGSRVERPGGDPLTIEHLVAVEPWREYRLDPRGRSVVFTAEAAGARQLFSMPLRGGTPTQPTQLTASEKNVSDPQWSPDGRRIAYVRDTAIRLIEADGSRATTVTDHPAANNAPRWSPDGRRIAFVSRRRGWAQVWVVDAPIPRRGRPAAAPKPPEPRAVTPPGLDVDEYEWSPDGERLAIAALRGPTARHASRISVIRVADGTEKAVGSGTDWECGPHWLADGGLLLLSDADGWFQIVHHAPDLETRTLLTSGPIEHGEMSGGFGYSALPSPDGERFTHAAIHDGYCDLVVAPIGAGAPAKRGRGRPPRVPRTTVPAGTAIQPWPGVWRSIGWLPDGAWVAAIGEDVRRPQDLWLLPVPEVAPPGARPRRITNTLPSVLGPAVSRFDGGERVAIAARDGLKLGCTLWRPSAATGRRGGQRVPAILFAHGGPNSQSFRLWHPFKQLLVREGFALLDVDYRGSTGYGRAYREGNFDEWGHADAFDIVDAGRWVQAQSWSNGRLAIWGGSYGGYMVLSALVEEPSMWRAGVDLYGDSEIAESYRHGDRPGRLDLERQMGRPDDPEREPAFRRGSPVYRAERIEAPLLILHGRKDRRVVPLMSERMIEALEIEGKFHEVHWYEDEGHGWQARENRRDAFTRIREFLRRHVLDAPADPAA
jgi:dipeptidyl aminopeptidase/acylaminoacyl peptidase